MIKRLVVFFVSWKILIYVFALLAVFTFPAVRFIGDFEFQHGYPYLVWIFGKFDGLHYMTIAKYGYTQYEYAFFPLYPVTISILRFIFDQFDLDVYRTVVGQIISLMTFFLALLVMKKLLDLDKKIHLLSLFLILLFLFPSSLFYGAVYNDSLFLFFACLTIYFSRKQSFLLASICGFFATLTRLNGLALCFIVFFEYIASLGFTKSTWDMKSYVKNISKIISLKNIVKKKMYAIALIPGAFVGYLAYIQIVFGDWSLVFSSMKVWQQDKVTFPLQVFWRYLKILVLEPTFSRTYWVAAIELGFVLFYIFLLIYSYKKIRLSYWLFFAISILIPSITGTFQGMPRYGLHIYPFFLSLVLFLEKKHIIYKLLYLVLSILLLFLFVAYFTRGYFIA